MLDPVIRRASAEAATGRRPAPEASPDRRRARFDAEPPGHLPAYLEDHYRWAYLRPASLRVFDHTPVVSLILWGCYGRLKRAAFAELEAGRKILQAACVYGDFSPRLAAHIGPEGRLDVVDIVPLQVANCRRKLRRFDHARVSVADAAAPGDGLYDVVFCFFLLHELPDDRKRRVVDALLWRLAPGGKVVFVDYHRPDRRHPLRPLMGLVFDWLEPFAKTLWRREISSFATGEFTWRKQTYFGGLYQKVVAERRVPHEPPS
jgi:SAM-dependent methyltransferase